MFFKNCKSVCTMVGKIFKHFFHTVTVYAIMFIVNKKLFYACK